MTREGALLVVTAVAVALVGLGLLAWRLRALRDAGFVAPSGDIPAQATTIATASGFYVATTRHGDPLERLAIRGLGFRSRLDVTVTDRGVALDLPGTPRLFLTASSIEAVELATVAIDRVVEPGGLVRLTWRAARTSETGGTAEAVDSYLRPQDVSARALADAIAASLPGPPVSLASPDLTPTPTGTDA
ncbi:MAG: hypothetical protein QM677_11225 [Microbacterium sp.]